MNDLIMINKELSYLLSVSPISLSKNNKIYDDIDNNDNNDYKTIEELCDFQYSDINDSNNDDNNDNEYPILGGGNYISFYTNKYNRDGKTCKIGRYSIDKDNCVMILNEKYYLNENGFTIISKNENVITNDYLFNYLEKNKNKVFECAIGGMAQKTLNIEKFKKLKIPLNSKLEIL
jgi:hypothetical protein